MSRKQLLLSILLVPTIAIFLGIAGSYTGQQIGTVPILLMCLGWVFLVNWLAFIPAFLLRTEKFYDLVGSFSYVSVVLLAMSLSAKIDFRSLIMGGLVIIWAGRLGLFLSRRIRKAGKDDRFDRIKTDALSFFNAWTLQALWVTFTALPTLIVITALSRVKTGFLGGLGFSIWLIGFTIEVLADYQKSRFRADPQNANSFIQSGLWAHSRHPNYFGEILLWIGMTIMALPVLLGWQWVALLSPLFVILLLTRISGVPMLERKADKKWGGQPEYEYYKTNTPVLIPKF